MEWLVWGEENVRLFDTEEYFLKVMTRIPVFLDWYVQQLPKVPSAKLNGWSNFLRSIFFDRERISACHSISHIVWKLL